MKTSEKWRRILFVAGVIALFLGAVDPLEGSVVIVAGSLLITLVLYLKHEPQWRCYLIAFLMIVFGVVFLFVLSWMGGFGGKSTLSWWWGTLILPYPLGWLLMIILLARKGYKQLKKQSSAK